jgi:hypothetical protein
VESGTRARQAIDAVLRADPPSAGDTLAALPLVAELRADLDRLEQQLIALARERRASWRQIAVALGLASRQAAEQRYLRLQAASGKDPAGVRAQRRRQRTADDTAGAEVHALRTQVFLLRNRLSGGAGPPAVRLAEQTLAAATDAPPGALYDLARLAVSDLRTVSRSVLGRPATEALERLASMAERRPGS